MGQIVAFERIMGLREARLTHMFARISVLEEVIREAETMLIAVDSSFNEVISKSEW
jgi:hypothetical protein